MTDTDDLPHRLNDVSCDIKRWRSEAERLREATTSPAAATDDELLLSLEETSGQIYGAIEAFDELVRDVDRKSHAAAGQVADVGDALRLVLMEITELGTRLYASRSSNMPDQSNNSPEPIEFATSSNGDRWFLLPAHEQSPPLIEHRANEPSGGATTRCSISTFLNESPPGPQHDALRTLIDAHPDLGDEQGAT